MNILDIIIIIMLISFVFIGYKKGFVSEIVQIIALSAAFFTAAPLGKWLGSILANNYNINKDLTFFAACLTAFLVVFSFIMIAGRIFAPVPAPDSILSAGNKISGSLLGLIKGFLAASLLVLLIRITPYSSFITDNVDYHPQIERNIYEQNLVKRAITNLKDGAVYLAADSANKELFSQTLPDSASNIEIDSVSLNQQPAKTKTKAKLGYLAYKLSTTMDPALDSYKKYLFSKVDKALEAVTQPALEQTISDPAKNN